MVEKKSGFAQSVGLSSPRAGHVMRIGLGVVLIWAAISKLSNPTHFLGSLYAYELPLPRDLLRLVAVVLPWTELLLGLLLIAGLWLESALAMVSVLLGIFVIATGQAWLRGLKISCGCLDLKLIGITDASDWTRWVESPGFALVRNCLLLIDALWLLRKRPIVRGFLGDPVVSGDRSMDTPAMADGKVAVVVGTKKTGAGKKHR